MYTGMGNTFFFSLHRASRASQSFRVASVCTYTHISLPFITHTACPGMGQSHQPNSNEPAFALETWLALMHQLARKGLLSYGVAMAQVGAITTHFVGDNAGSTPKHVHKPRVTQLPGQCTAMWRSLSCLGTNLGPTEALVRQLEGVAHPLCSSSIAQPQALLNCSTKTVMPP